MKAIREILIKDLKPNSPGTRTRIVGNHVRRISVRVFVLVVGLNEEMNI